MLGMVIVTSCCGYLFFGYKPVESIWMTVITLSSVGYSERPSMGMNEQLFTCAVIVIGMVTVATTCGSFVQMLVEGELEKSIGNRKNTREISKLKDHVVICGFGRLGQILADDLRHTDTPFVIIDRDEHRVEMIRQSDYLFIEGDTTDETTLMEAGIKNAKTLVTVLPSDACNVFVTLTGRNLNPRLRIVSRAENRSSVRKLYQAGVDRVVLPTMIGAQQISRLISRPNTADLVELLSQRGSLDVELDELVIDKDSPLAGMTLIECHTEQNDVLIIAAKKIDGQMVFNPKPDFLLSVGDTLIMLGRSEDIAAFGNRVEELVGS